jgi:23S rRNA (cytidine1920-2'-O)/16S rRNA (cytidine1409-2'-O)-methyltransferase
VGASTGGFTDALLAAGARSVTAVDVGYGQLAPALRDDPRVHVLERTNARSLARGDLPCDPALGTVDVSFISVRLLLPALVAAAPGAEWLVMVKPQFEVGRERVGKGGVVRDAALRHEAADTVAETARALGLGEAGRADSRLPGPKGNVEIFLHLRRDPADPGDSGPAG